MLPSIRLSFEFEGTAEGTDKAVALLKFADKMGVPSVPDEPKGAAAPPPPAKGKAGQTPPPPAKGKAAAPAAGKANSKAKPKDPEPDTLDLNLGDEEDEEESGGLGLGDDDEPAEDFDGTPEDAKEEALAILRTMLGNGLKDDVKKIQKIMNVAKFHDVPAEKGHEFLAQVKKVEAEINKRN